MKNEITYLGKVINVNSSTIEAEISRDIPSAAPIIKGKIHRIGQIGTLVKIPVGNLSLFGMVSSVSNSPSDINESKPQTAQFNNRDYGSRFIQIQLLGERLGKEGFVKGVGTYPTINDEVHIVLESDLEVIYGHSSESHIEVGKHSSSDHLGVHLDLQSLVSRHCSILGSTGSGKSNATAHIVREILAKYEGSRIVLIDTHGEYTSAFNKSAKTLRINDSSNPLYIPFWAMNYEELSYFLVGADEKSFERTENKRLREEVTSLKKGNAKKLQAGNIDETCVTADSPIPFNIKELWMTFYSEVNASYSVAGREEQTPDKMCIVEQGNADSLKPPQFAPYSMSNAAPYKSKKQDLDQYYRKIYSRLRDQVFSFMFDPGEYANERSGKDLNDLLKDWIDHDQRLTILDLSGIPHELVDISVGIITRIIFDSMYWGRHESYTGRSRPLLMIYEEAHAYLPKNEGGAQPSGYARKAVEKVFKEGRKFGMGAIVVSQRPSELSQTILAQVGTYIALRLTNSNDKNAVQSLAPNNMTDLIELLPSLRVGEAIVVGESIVVPSRVRMPLVEPRPSSDDPDVVKAWKKTFKDHQDNYKKIVQALRERKSIG